MTDKQIIVDGVDVSRCGLLDDCRYYCEIFEERCSKKPNCYYKRLIRKEQECEMLKFSEKSLTETIENIARGFEELKAENERLNNIINEAKNSKLDLKSFLVGEAIQKEYEQQLDQLKQAIENVREIAKEHVPRCDIPSYECDYERDCEACHYSDLKQILQICDEVKDETTNN